MRGLGHGQVWWADLDRIRPVVVLTRSSVAPMLSRVLVAPITSTVREIPSEVSIGRDEGVDDGSVVNLDNIELIPVIRLLRQTGSITDVRWPDVCRALQHTIGC